MIVTVEEVKNYLRVDFEDDDSLIQSFIGVAERLCQDILRTDTMEHYTQNESVRVAVMYAVAYLYEHRDEAEHNTLIATLKNLLSAFRLEVF